MRSPRNEFESGEILAFPEDGADIYLTVNHCIQAIVEEELAKGVKKAKAKSGWAVMMDPFTGEILALAQYPFFYPSDYRTYFNNPAMVEDTSIKPVCNAYEPGSVMKAITISIALLANDEMAKRGEPPIFNPEEMLPCADGKFPGRPRPFDDTNKHAYLNMNMAIQKSSNIYPARLVEKIISRLGNEWYRQALSRTFGLGVKTGIELPSETAGLLPNIGKLHPNGTLEWSLATPYSLAIGYNLQANSIQLARTYAIFANGGYFVKPTLIRKIIKKGADGQEIVLVDNTSPERCQTFPRVISQNIAAKVIKAMKYATKPGGLAWRGDVWGYTECGKTSTSKKNKNGKYSETEYRGSFMGIVPVKHPAFVLLVTLDEPEYGYVAGIGKVHNGGLAAAPVFREIAKRTLEYLGISPDDPYGYPSGDPRSDKEKADWMPETRRLQEMYKKWNNKAQH
jgi:cell division protein FtsI (penicillin-binding protein 3)